jgi:hypothetical protein
MLHAVGFGGVKFCPKPKPFTNRLNLKNRLHLERDRYLSIARQRFNTYFLDFNGHDPSQATAELTSLENVSIFFRILCGAITISSELSRH